MMTILGALFVAGVATVFLMFATRHGKGPDEADSILVLFLMPVAAVGLFALPAVLALHQVARLARAVLAIRTDSGAQWFSAWRARWLLWSAVSAAFTGLCWFGVARGDKDVTVSVAFFFTVSSLACFAMALLEREDDRAKLPRPQKRADIGRALLAPLGSIAGLILALSYASAGREQAAAAGTGASFLHGFMTWQYVLAGVIGGALVLAPFGWIAGFLIGQFVGQPGGDKTIAVAKEDV